jgi:hypothetical protein
MLTSMPEESAPRPVHTLKTTLPCATSTRFLHNRLYIILLIAQLVILKCACKVGHNHLLTTPRVDP